MNKNKVNKISIINIVIFWVLFFFAVLVLVMACRNSNQAVMPIPFPIKFEGEQEYVDGDLVLRGQFSEELPEGAQMNFYLNHIGISIYLNGEMIYESAYENYPEMCGNAWEMW
ncbi:MAG: hypothetical protein SOZ81_00580, partial [Agathobacter sp.]|nr:hypothetical protein [Agathobacter sp.]